MHFDDCEVRFGPQEEDTSETLEGTDPDPELAEDEDFGELPTGDFAGEDPVKEQLADMFDKPEVEEDQPLEMEITEDERFELAIKEGRAAQIVDHTVYRLQTLKMETKERKSKWNEFKAQMLESAKAFFDYRSGMIEDLEERIKTRMAMLQEDAHETPAGIRVSLTKPSLRNIPIDTAEGALEEMNDEVVDSWPFLEIKRTVTMNKSALRAWIKEEAEKKYPPDKKEDDETKAKRIAYAIKLVRNVPFLTCEVPDYGLRVTARGFDPFSSLRQIMGPEDAEEILQPIFQAGYSEGSET